MAGLACGEHPRHDALDPVHRALEVHLDRGVPGVGFWSEQAVSRKSQRELIEQHDVRGAERLVGTVRKLLNRVVVPAAKPMPRGFAAPVITATLPSN